MVCARIVVLPCWPFEIPHLNKLYSGLVLNNSYTLSYILMIFGIHVYQVYQVKTVCHMQERLLHYVHLLRYLH